MARPRQDSPLSCGSDAQTSWHNSIHTVERILYTWASSSYSGNFFGSFDLNATFPWSVAIRRAPVRGSLPRSDSEAIIGGGP